MVNERFKAGQPLKTALIETLAYLHRKLEGRGGLIAIDRLGHTEAAFTTPDMAFAGPSCTQLTY
jgi:isoaspartyl peptidase/L-asparaginase-like protein (Ntn-hydrolase superfamily)